MNVQHMQWASWPTCHGLVQALLPLKFLAPEKTSILPREILPARRQRNLPGFQQAIKKGRSSV